MKKLVTLEVDCVVEVDEEAAPDVVSRTQTEDWRGMFYDLNEEETYEVLAWGFGVKGWSQLDGWADVPRGAIQGYVLDRNVIYVEDY